MMRIITGTARGTKLFTNEGLETRPTSERAKEALFSIIQFDIEGRSVLDLFSGTGQLALEALSRGASSAVMVDKSRAAISIITKNAEKTHLIDKCKIVSSDYFAYLTQNNSQKFDIVFIDPPYNENIIPEVLTKLNKNNILKPTSIIVCESENSDVSIFGENSNILKDKYTVVKSSKYGISYITILKPVFDKEEI